MVGPGIILVPWRADVDRQVLTEVPADRVLCFLSLLRRSCLLRHDDKEWMESFLEEG